MRLSIVLTGAVAGLLAISACAAPPPLTPSAGPWRFSGTVSGMDGSRVGGPIAGAELTIVSGVNVNTLVKSDAAGRYVFPSLASGRFTVAIEAPGYVSTTPAIDLYRDTEVNFALKPR